MLSNYQANRGFSLTEIMLVVLIFCATLVALAKFASDLFAIGSYAQQRTEAINLAQEKLDDFRSYGELNTTAGYVAYQDIVSGSDTVAGTNSTFTRTWTVTPNTVIGYKTVSVAITWTAQDGTNKSVTLNSIIGQIDPALSGEVNMALPTGTITP